MSTPTTEAPLRLGLQENLAQFSLLVGVNALVGGMIGQERTVLPLLAKQEFGLTAFTATLTFIVAFGAVKAATNFFAGTLSDRYGRKPVLVAGWIIGVPVPLLLIWAPTWGWVVFANVLLGVNQGLTWSTTVIMKIDLVGPARRGFAMGLNEAAGYGAVAITALATGFIAEHAGLRPEPFFLGIAYAGLGLGLSVFFVRETRGHARHEAANHVTTNDTHHGALTTGEIFRLTSFTRQGAVVVHAGRPGQQPQRRPRLGPVPDLLRRRRAVDRTHRRARRALPRRVGPRPAVTGGLSDRIGRKPLIVGGMLTQAVAIAWIAATGSFAAWAVGAMVLGAGTAMVYPTLLAAIGDVAHPTWRARSVGDLPAVARRRLRRRRAPRRHPRRPHLHPRRDLGRRRAHRRRPASSSRCACTRPTRDERAGPPTHARSTRSSLPPAPASIESNPKNSRRNARPAL